MKFVSSVVLSVVLSLGAVLGYVHINTVDFTQLRQMTKQLATADGTGFCSSVVVGPEMVVTAAHCDIEGQPIYINGVQAKIVKKDVKQDLLLLHVPSLKGAPLEVGRAVMDEVVYVVGFPLEAGQVVTQGRAQSVVDGSQIFTAPIIFGNSGGPVFVVRHGQPVLVAIVSRGTLVPLMGMFPARVGHLNYGSPVDQFLK